MNTRICLPARDAGIAARLAVRAEIDDQLDQVEDDGRNRDGVVARLRLDAKSVGQGLGACDPGLRLEAGDLDLPARP